MDKTLLEYSWRSILFQFQVDIGGVAYAIVVASSLRTVSHRREVSNLPELSRREDQRVRRSQNRRRGQTQALFGTEKWGFTIVLYKSRLISINSSNLFDVVLILYSFYNNSFKFFFLNWILQFVCFLFSNFRGVKLKPSVLNGWRLKIDILT